MGRLKTEADRTSKRLLRTRVDALEKQTFLLTQTLAKILREAMTVPTPSAPVSAEPTLPTDPAA